MAKIFSLDAEVDGLYGRAFAIAATVREDGREIAAFTGRIADEHVGDSWVQENVLPALVGMEVTHTSYDELEEAFWAFWLSTHVEGEWGPGPDPQLAVIAHCGAPVESGLFARCVMRDEPSRKFKGPMPLHEVGSLLLACGENPSSVDGYNKKNGLAVPFEGVAHHPMYDAAAAAVAWEHAMARLAPKAE
mgnify:CR=1 FL=1